MAENAGGLNYQLNVGGDFEAKLASFRSQIAALESSASKLKGTSAGSAGATGNQQQTITKLTELEKAQQKEALALLKKKNTQLAEAVKRVKKLTQEAQKEAAARNKSITQGADKAALKASQQLKQDMQAKAKQAQRYADIQAKDAATRNKIITQGNDSEARYQSNLIKQQMLSGAVEAKKAKKASEYNNIALQAKNQNASAARNLQILNERANILSKQQGISWAAAARQVGITSEQAKGLGKHLVDAESVARQFLFTFRRLVGILAIFTAARLFAQAIGRGVQEMIRMNSEVETTKNSIATLISSVGRIYNEQGRLLTGQEAFTASLQESDTVVRQLQKDAIGSVATFESLTKAFQVAIGPGLAAGLDVKQVTTVTKRLVEGAVAMKVPLDQMSEEIRSILQGTATSKNTRLVSLFGGSASEVNQQIKKAKEAGNLYGYLMDKLKGVEKGAAAAALTMTVLKSDLQDTTSLLAKEGGTEYFNALKEAILGLRNALASPSGDTGFVFNADALAIVKEVSGILANMIRTFRELTSTSQDLNLLRNLLATIADIMSALLPITVAIFQGILTGINAVLAPLRVVAEIWRRFLGENAGTLNKNIARIVGLLVSGIVPILLWKKTLEAIAFLSGAKGLLGIFRKVGLALVGNALAAQGVNATMAITVVQTQGWAAALGLVKTELLFAFGWVGIILGVLSAILVYTGAWGRIQDKIVSAFRGTNKEAKDFQGYTKGASDNLEKLRPELAGMADRIKKLNEETASLLLLNGVEDTAKKILELYIQRDQILKDTTKIEEDGLSATRSKLAALEAEKQARKSIEDEAARATFNQALNTKTQQKATKSWLTSLVDAVPLLRRLAPSLATPASASNQTFTQDRSEEIRRNRDNQISLAKQQISNYEQEILTKRNQLNEEYSASVRKVLAENEALKASRKLTIDRVQAEGDVAAARAKAFSSSVADALSAKTRVLVLQEQAKALDDQYEKTVKLFKEQELLAQGIVDMYSDSAKEAEMLQKIIDDNATPKNDRENASRRLDGVKTEIQARKDAQAQLDAMADQRAQAEYKLATDKQALLAESINAQQEADRATLKASKSFVDGIELGLRDFVQNTPQIGEAIGASIKSALDGVAGAFGSAFKEYIRTGENVSVLFYTALGDVFLNIAEEFATTVAKRMISAIAENVLGLSFNVASDAPLIAAQTANTASLNALTVALGGNTAITATDTAATTVDAAATTANTGSMWAHAGTMLAHAGTMVAHGLAVTFNTVAMLANTAMLVVKAAIEAAAAALGSLGSVLVVAAVTVQTVILGGILLGIAGLLATANILLLGILATNVAGMFFNKGGLVPKGYAEGGGIARPASIPASDTVPAWLTPGEYVLPVPLVRKLGVGFLERLRAGVAPPESFRSAASHIMGTGQAIRGYAAGGPVGTSTSTSDGSNDKNVNVAFFDDRKKMRRWAESSEGETAILKVMKKNAFKFA